MTKYTQYIYFIGSYTMVLWPPTGGGAREGTCHHPHWNLKIMPPPPKDNLTRKNEK